MNIITSSGSTTAHLPAWRRKGFGFWAGRILPPVRAGIRVTRVETNADFRAFVSITHEVFGMADRLAAELRHRGARR